MTNSCLKVDVEEPYRKFQVHWTDCPCTQIEIRCGPVKGTIIRHDLHFLLPHHHSVSFEVLLALI